MGLTTLRHMAHHLFCFKAKIKGLPVNLVLQIYFYWLYNANNNHRNNAALTNIPFKACRAQRKHLPNERPHDRNHPNY